MKHLLAGLAAVAAMAAPAQAARLYAVDETNNLITFDSRAPGTTLSSVALQGVTGSSLLAMDYRVFDRTLYAHTDDGRIITINPTTGATATFANLAVTGTNFAFDFNPTNNNLRIVSNDDTNYVYNFMTNALVPGANVAYGPGALMGANPDITAGAYTFNDTDPATGTTLYVIDSRNNVLATQNAMTGVLTLVGDLGTSVGARTSFDIVTQGGNNVAFAQSADRFLSVDLGTGMLSQIGTTDRSLFALTAAGAVPEPTSWAMMIAGFGLVGAASRRNRRTMVAVSA
ncbi:DUF4394 domain-containing protein [Polymorphobacter fuscus]|uniref:DUF4394 domain-containing protein n=1 Tax=Sandarakinorhabdus fusca TaxID=1439888 RepID=A0A7C9GPV5_9SPHN|nr:DUF4394 domain-containing protein [Polymorphobacter fuscus]KAB7646622.1 DUF4394 domain-containing protein [Polymorphobacter fuscus]MQT17797.1 DUF4394 domain-containing protein [Polymorphobacter fuscus]NJC09654.1 hypothetical protein [Polymorphobacter fuscus]